ncbi:2-oxoglutarate dehydrogenase E1 component [Mucilaginibacter corticis]|uniref:oxoglutarate dehydrogenase (succinyl-transferring) n=1 Tax=Mucilaginibacter corticis TaxID=2597670 RepID=A0A556MRS4_9SPHI|nr:2-oxoglutarate dehydrogenase E1 component [Mucilaginibacter corticis]TSJ42664.1 2-oxoglutarate dehydrogenase E1 component [Mucilaginibacter corticis]
MDSLNYINSNNAAFIDSLYEAYKQDPQSVEFGWQKFFEGFDFGRGSQAPTVSAETPDHFLKEINVLNMIDGYRGRGHLFAKTNPVRERRQYFPGKELETFGLAQSDLDTVFNAGVEVGMGPSKLRDIAQMLEETYCGPIGAEYHYIRNPIKVKWFQDRMESQRNKPSFSVEEKKLMLRKVSEAVIFENFLGTKFLGQKRFSLEGAEALIPAMDSVIQKGATLGIQEFTIGMAHRGRLNVLANIMKKTYKEIFSEFEGKNYDEDSTAGGDVKYHLGFSTDVEAENGKKVHLSLCPNPSHLEAVDPVVEGLTRSKIDFKYNGDHTKIAPILIHGDASVAGQGIVYEVLQMEKLDGYRTGGTIHLVINNQIGFTTNFVDARSSTYCTDVAKTVLSPVFHVNGDDVEALAYVINMAMEYRQVFHDDVFIDILCYRRYGHNEADEPKFTQPVLYKAIEAHPNPREVYLNKLMAENIVADAEVKQMEQDFRSLLQKELDESKAQDRFTESAPMFAGAWNGLHLATERDFIAPVNTAVAKDELLAIGKKLTELPKNKVFFKKIEKLFEERGKMVNDTQTFDWAMGELMAYGSLLKDGHPVRLSGEDVKRGTFSHRHAVLTLADSEEEYTPMNSIEGEKFSIYNSLLSEYGVLGFEYGYALANPNALTIWEAQFGDFFNGAQTIVDQYIVSAETKWQRGNGLVMLLPHGYEGQGPEHSSARIERFMELCADNNIQVANCTTPANFFHILRRQMYREFRKPLIIFTPKSLLRNPKCVSPLADFTDGGFKEVIDDNYADAKKVKRVLFCSGKIYYDLLEKQQADERKDVAIVRLEQLYPTPVQQLSAIRARYTKATDFIWVQEEPENMGAWPYLYRKSRTEDALKFDIISRNESASTATGFAKQHAAQQLYIVSKAFESPAGKKVKEAVKATAEKMATAGAD